MSPTHPLTYSRLTLGTRGSPLALAQSRHVAAALQAAHPELEIVERIIRTSGDEVQNVPLRAIGGKGVFTLEIEATLLNGKIDFAVHSLKDLPPDMPAGTCLAAVPPRASARDILVLKTNRQESDITRIGTSSVRRKAMLLSQNPDWEIDDVRGNVGTRLRKLEESFDALVLAEAGLQRLQLDKELRERLLPLDETTFIPAPGQGALGIQSRDDDQNTLALLQALEHDETRAAIIAERVVMRVLNAGCSTPLGAHAVCEGGVLTLRAVVLSPDGKNRIDTQGKSIPERAKGLGESVAQKLLDGGAQKLLSDK